VGVFFLRHSVEICPETGPSTLLDVDDFKPRRHPQQIVLGFARNIDPSAQTTQQTNEQTKNL